MTDGKVPCSPPSCRDRSKTVRVTVRAREIESQRDREPQSHRATEVER